MAGNKHNTSPHRLCVPLLLIIFISIIPLPAGEASTQTSRPPDIVVLQNDQTLQWAANSTSLTTLDLTFHASPDDATIANPNYPTLSYYLSFNTTTPDGNVTGWTLPPVRLPVVPISNRSGWYRTNINTIGPITAPGTYIRSISVYFNNSDTGELGLPSCVVTVDMMVTGSHDQCGQYLSQSAGIQGIFTPSDGIASPSILNTRWPLSTDDENQTAGNLTYQLLLQETFTDNFGNTNTTQQLLYDPRDSDDSAGVRSINITFAFGSNLTPPPGDLIGFSTWTSLHIASRAIDDTTNLWSKTTCYIAFTPNPQSVQTSFCGFLSQAQLDYQNGARHISPLSPSPSFPAVDFASVSASTGLDTAALGYILGALLIAGCAIAGYAIARQTGAIIAPIFGLALTGLMNLWPLWLLAFIFLAITGLAVLLLANGRST